MMECDPILALTDGTLIPFTESFCEAYWLGKVHIAFVGHEQRVRTASCRLHFIRLALKNKTDANWMPLLRLMVGEKSRCTLFEKLSF